MHVAYTDRRQHQLVHICLIVLGQKHKEDIRIILDACPGAETHATRTFSEKIAGNLVLWVYAHIAVIKCFQISHTHAQEKVKDFDVRGIVVDPCQKVGSHACCMHKIKTLQAGVRICKKQDMKKTTYLSQPLLMNDNKFDHRAI